MGDDVHHQPRGERGLRRRHRLQLGADRVDARGDLRHSAAGRRAPPRSPDRRRRTHAAARCRATRDHRRMKSASILFNDVTKRYGDVAAVDRHTFAIAAGTLVTLLGPSGCGKTTTLRLIAGLELPTSGAVAIGERDVTHLPASERDVSMVFQSYALFPHMSVLENVRYGLVVSKLPRAKADERARAALQT